MRPVDTLRAAAQALVENPVRTLLTLLGVIIGVACVVSMTAIGAGAQQRVAEQISSFGANVLIVNPAPPTRTGEFGERRSEIPHRGGRRGDRRAEHHPVRRAVRLRNRADRCEGSELVDHGQRHHVETFRDPAMGPRRGARVLARGRGLRGEGRRVVPSLFVIRGNDQGTRFELEEPILRLGAASRAYPSFTIPKSPGNTPNFAARIATTPSPT